MYYNLCSLFSLPAQMESFLVYPDVLRIIPFEAK